MRRLWTTGGRGTTQCLGALQLLYAEVELLIPTDGGASVREEVAFAVIGVVPEVLVVLRVGPRLVG